MKIKVKKTITIQPGEIIDVPDQQAQDLIKRGLAYPPIIAKEEPEDPGDEGDDDKPEDGDDDSPAESDQKDLKK